MVKDPNKALFTTRTRRGMISLLLLALFAALLLWLAKPLIGWVSAFTIPCLLHLLGYNCPFCGGTRCVRALLDFEIKTAIYYNPLVFICIAAFAVYLVCCLFSCFGKEYKPVRIKLGNSGIYAILAAVLIFTVIRNMPFYKAIFY